MVSVADHESVLTKRQRGYLLNRRSNLAQIILSLGLRYDRDSSGQRMMLDERGGYQID